MSIPEFPVRGNWTPEARRWFKPYKTIENKYFYRWFRPYRKYVAPYQRDFGKRLAELIARLHNVELATSIWRATQSRGE